MIRYSIPLAIFLSSINMIACHESKADKPVTNLIVPPVSPRSVVTDKARLALEIEESSTLLGQAKFGTQVGQYPPEAKDLLQKSIDQAKAVWGLDTSTQLEIDQQVNELSEAKRLFIAKKITETAKLAFANLVSSLEKVIEEQTYGEFAGDFPITAKDSFTKLIQEAKTKLANLDIKDELYTSYYSTLEKEYQDLKKQQLKPGDSTQLNRLVAEAENQLKSFVIGTRRGEYPPSSEVLRSQLQGTVDEAKKWLKTPKATDKHFQAQFALIELAIKNLKGTQNPDDSLQNMINAKEQLKDDLESSLILIQESVEGRDIGQYSSDAKSLFLSKVNDTKTKSEDPNLNFEDIDQLSKQLKDARLDFEKSKIVKGDSKLLANTLSEQQERAKSFQEDIKSLQEFKNWQKQEEKAKLRLEKDASQIRYDDSLRDLQNSWKALLEKLPKTNSGRLSYEQLKEKARFNREVTPWSDTYWPFFNVGHTERWIKDDRYDGTYRSFYKFLTSLLQTLKSEDRSQEISQIASLSPAEKYDILQIGDYQRSFAKLSQTESAIKDLFEAADISDFSLDRQSLEAFENSENWKGILENAKRIDEELSQSLRNNADTDVQKQARAEAAAKIRRLIEDSVYFRRNFPVISEAWLTWASFSANQLADGEWNWQGHCGGWSPAALYEEAPKHGVLAEYKGKSVLFTQGDIRGLLSKAWTSPQVSSGALQMIGRRCLRNPEYVVSNSDLAGAQYDGNFIDKNDNAADPFLILNWFEVPSSEGQESYLGLSYLEKGSLQTERYALLYKRSMLTSDPSRIYLYRDLDKPEESFGGDGVDNVFLTFSDKNELLAWAKNRDENLSTKLENDGKTVNIDLACKDLGPDRIIEFLVKEFNEKKTSFIIDRDYSSEVWNQPVSGYDFALSELMTRDEVTLSRYDKSRLHPKTQYLARLVGKVSYISEPRRHLPIIPEGFDANQKQNLNLEFYLEFDENQELLSGFWDGKSKSERFRPDYIGYYKSENRPADVKALKNDYNQNSKPDTKNKKSSIFDIRLLKQIHKCSVEGQADQSLKMRYLNETENEKVGTVRYVNCQLQD